MSRVWMWYNYWLEKEPLFVKALTSLTGFTLGDILAQKFIRTDGDKRGEDAGIDWKRTARLGTFGLLVHGPLGHYWYGFLDRNIPGTATKTVATKVALDQLLYNPMFNTIFFTYLGLTEGKSVAEILEKIEQDLPTAVVGSWTVWIPAHAINFRYVPPSQRLLYINTVQVGYNVFLSFLGNRPVDNTRYLKPAKEGLGWPGRHVPEAKNPWQKPPETRTPKEKIEAENKAPAVGDEDKPWSFSNKKPTGVTEDDPRVKGDV